MSTSIVIFEKDSDTVEIIKSYLADVEDVVIEQVFTDYNAGIRYVKTNAVDIAIYSVESDVQLSYRMQKRLADYGVKIIALSEDYTTSNIIQALRYGAVDFVSKPVLKKDLISAVSKCCTPNIKVLKKSQIIAIYSNKGGIGKTTIGVNLAVELAKLTRDKVALVDLNFPIGDITTFLDLKPKIGISEIVNNITSDKCDFITDACVKYKDTELYVLAEPQYAEKPNLTQKQLLKLFDGLRNTFSYIIIDMSANIDKFNTFILNSSDIIILPTIINLPLIRSCQRCLDMFDNLEYSKNKVKLVVNRYLENDEITVKDAEKALGRSVYWKLPNNYFTVMSSINKGIPVSQVNENSNITDSFSKLASKIVDDMFEQDLK